MFSRTPRRAAFVAAALFLAAALPTAAQGDSIRQAYAISAQKCASGNASACSEAAVYEYALFDLQQLGCACRGGNTSACQRHAAASIALAGKSAGS